jgi:hypothetical protein
MTQLCRISLKAITAEKNGGLGLEHRRRNIDPTELLEWPAPVGKH